MNFDQYMTQVPRVEPGAARADRAARRGSGTKRDPMATKRGRQLVQRLVSKMSRNLHVELDFKRADWPKAIDALSSSSDKALQKVKAPSDLLTLKGK